MRKESIRYIHLQPDGDLPDISDLAPFKVIVIADNSIDEMWIWDASRWLVASGCRYVMAWGNECDSWAESVEEATSEAFNYEAIPEESQVIATAHEDDPLDEVFWFSKNKAHHPVHELNNTVILHVSAHDKQAEIKQQYDEA
jgi:hypothetical protein